MCRMMSFPLKTVKEIQLKQYKALISISLPCNLIIITKI